MCLFHVPLKVVAVSGLWRSRDPIWARVVLLNHLALLDQGRNARAGVQGAFTPATQQSEEEVELDLLPGIL